MTRIVVRVVVALAVVAWFAPAARAQSEDTKAARDLFEAGKRAYNLGEFDKAVELWKQGYEKKDDPLFLFNIAQAYRQKPDYAKAIFFYKAYLREDPGTKNRAAVEQRIVEMQTLLDASQTAAEADPKGVGEIAGKTGTEAAGGTGIEATGGTEGTGTETETEPTPAPTPPGAYPPPEPGPPLVVDAPAPGRGLKITGLAVGGAGVALVVTGVVFALRASSLESELEDAVAAGTPWNEDLDAKRSDGDSAALISKITLTAGIAAVAVGGTLFVLGQKKDKRAPEATAGLDVTPLVGPTGAGLVFTWTY